MVAAPVITQHLDASPAPRVEVLFPSFAAGTATVTVYRSAAGREYEVRSAVRAATAGALTRIDNEVPFGVPVTYRAQMFDADGISLGYTGTASTQLDVDEMWIHNPLDPAGAIRADFSGDRPSDLTRESEGDVYYPQKRRVGVLVSGQRRGLSKVTLDIVVDDLGTADRFASMLGGYDTDTVPALCVRVGAADRVRLPRPLFAAVLSTTEQDVSYFLGGETIRFAMTGDEIAPPATGIVVPLLTNADIDAHYATNAALNADNRTNLDVNRRYELAGTAG